MFKNCLLTALRDLKKNKIYSFINVFGLAIGMACCIVIMLFVQDELSYDRFHKNAHQIYRLTVEKITPQGKFRHTITRWNTAPSLINDFPEVVDAVRLTKHRWFVIEYGEKRLTTDPVFADPSILSVFSFPLIKGDKNSVLNDPNGVVISEDLAEKIFGDKDPIGKTLTLYDIDHKYDLQITGIMKNIPYNSYLRFDFLVPLKHLETRKGFTDPQKETCVTYLLLNKHADLVKFQKKLPSFALKYYGKEFVSKNTFILQSLTSIYLHSNLDFDEIQEVKGNPSASYSLSAVALVILLIACINFMNLSTAKSSRRYKEVGMRRVVGARRLQLIRQFLGESVLLSFIALLIAVVLALILLPFFNTLMWRHLTMNFKGNLYLYVGLVLLTLFVGFVSGSYPAIFLSSIRPAEVLKGGVRKGTILGVFLRKGLIVFQFAISLVFIIGTIVIYRQLNFVRNKDLGFKKENIIEIDIFKDGPFTQRSELIKRELSQHPNIQKVIVSAGDPGFYNGWPILCVPEGFLEASPVEMNYFEVGEGFFDFFGINIIEGRDFSKEMVTDAESAVIINETAVKSLGWKQPIGKQIKSDQFESKKPVTVIGVVKDFHNGSLHEKIKPSIYKFNPQGRNSIFIQIDPLNKRETIAFLEKKWRQLPTHLLFEYFFMDDALGNRYSEDRNIGKVFAFSSILAIVIACLGLFGLASFTAEQRIKEIGIRKVLGASVTNIVLLLSKDFSRLVLFANIIGWPIGYYVSHRWLQTFAYRIGIGWWVFVIGAALVFFISLSAGTYQSIKAASSNPADTLRYE
jgi:putative ABC transport system permease protein